MNYKEILMNQIISNCVGIIPYTEYQTLYNILSATMYPYHVELKEEQESFPMIVDDYNTNMLNKYLVEKMIQGKARSTIDMYQYRLKQFLNFINKKITNITSDDIKIYLANYKISNKCSGTTMDHIRICINGFYVWLMDNEYIPRNPVKNVPKIKNDTIKEDPFSITELELIRDSCNNLRNRALVEFLLATGCRVSEAVSINKDQIDFESKQFKVIGKGDKTRTIPINDKAILHIKKYINSRIDNTDAMFVTLNKPHRRMTIDAVESMLKTLETKSGVFNIHPHRFRRTLCCILINSGMPITQVAEILGHSSVSTTEIYYSQSMYQIQVNYSKLANF